MGKIYIIVNPAAGTEEPIVAYIEESLKGISYEVMEATESGDIYKIANEVPEDASLLVVYGGDGSVCEAAKALHGKKTPLFILPGGTANVMAKEIGMPADTKDALALLASGKYFINAIDMGVVNGCPFLLRINLGILADMITETSTDMKDRWGQWAYGITAFREMPSEGPVYKITIDGQQYDQQAVALTVTNAGNIGKEGYSFAPGISVTDGLLDIIALDRSSMLTLIKLAGNIMLHQESADIKHWKAKEISISLPKQATFLCDDAEQSATDLYINVSPSSLNIAYPTI